MNVYLASSWRNLEQPRVLKVLKDGGHRVCDFRNPTLTDKGFAWSDIDPEWKTWAADRYRAQLHHPLAEHGFRLDMSALEQCDACVLLLPCGRSAHLEAGHAAGAKKRLVIYTRDGEEPELMYKMGRVVLTDAELLAALR